MTLKNEVCALEYAKRLKELGVKQESYFCWAKCINSNEFTLWRNFERFQDHYIETNGCYSAFTVAELGEMLPDQLRHPDEDDQSIQLICEKNILWNITYAWYHFKCIKDINEANARAKMLIYLLENGLIKNE